jgi:4-amino-4-deoxy-L-arabinose transferase-like glycosyltransferase
MLQHQSRVALLMAFAAAQLGWGLSRTEATFADGLRYVHQAEQLECGSWTSSLIKGIDHPLHPLGISAVHRLQSGANPDSWQRAALVLCFTCAVLLVIPIYLLTLDLFGERAAWLACVLVIINPIVGYIVVNVLSESTFLLFWCFGLWSAVRFLREGRPPWLAPAFGFGALAYLTRPEGMLLPAALTATLMIQPLLEARNLNWQRWRRVVACSLGGIVLLAGPYMTLRGGVATKPAIARVLGLAPRSQALALEREKPLPPGQSDVETYRLATIRMLKVFRAAVTPILFPFSLLGLVVAGGFAGRAKAGLFLSIVLAASAVALLRLHATGGYCTVRHGLVPGVILTLAAANGIAWLMGRSETLLRRYSPRFRRLQPGLAVSTGLIGLLVVIPILRTIGPLGPGPFSVYRAAGQWIARNASVGEEVLDLTDWSLFFSGRPGYVFASVYEAAANRRTRWIVARKPHVDGHWHYSGVLRNLIGGRDPVVLLPLQATPGQVQIQIYDLLAAAPTAAANDNNTDRGNTRR